MKISTRLCVLLACFSFCSYLFGAVTVVECEDEQGNRSFEKTCAPGSTQVGKKQFNTGAVSSEKKLAMNIQAKLYMIPDCESCDDVKEFLNARNIPITEIDVSDDIELQNELKNIAGALKVPTTLIGDEILTGYNRSSLLEALVAAGYEENNDDS